MTKTNKQPYARTDSNFTPLPVSLPDFGKTGSVFTDASFNPTYPPRYVRVTDPSTPKGGAFSVGTGNGDDIHFSSDDTLLWVTNDGAAIYIYELVPDTMQVGLISMFPIPVSWGNGHFSQISPRIFYTLNPQTCQLWMADFTGIDIANPSDDPPVKMVYDFTAEGLPAPATFAGIAGGDRYFAAYFGPQDDPECCYVAVYDSLTGTCSILNSMTGLVGGMTVSTADRFYLHGAHLCDPKGAWMWVTRSMMNPGPVLYAWAIGSPLLIPIGPYSDGHAAGNSQGVFNNASHSPSGYPSLLFRRWVDFGTSKVEELNTGRGAYDASLDTHATTKNDPLGRGRAPIFASTTAPHTIAAYQNEIIAWQQPHGPVLRFGRTFNSGSDLESFQGKNAIGAVSQTGRFFAFTSDGELTLGRNSNDNLYRSDVFILALPQGAPWL